jgi:hypothetical protein
MPSHLDLLLSQFELFEPDLGREFHYSAHVQMLARGHTTLTAWEASNLNYFYGPALMTAFNFFVGAFRLPAKLEELLLRSAGGSQSAWWMSSLSQYERIERVHVASAEMELHYADKHGRYQMRLASPPLADDQLAAVIDWLTTDPSLPLNALARGTPLEGAALQRLGLIPPWESVLISLDSRRAGALELGAKFACRALALYPAHLLLWRGVNGEAALQSFLQKRLAQRQADFDAVAATLPAAPEEFWAMPALPELPPLAEVTPDPGLGAHLSAPNFWPKPEDNQLFLTTAQKVYKSVPKKILRLVKPKPGW